MEKINGWLRGSILIFVAITLFLQTGYALALAGSGELSKVVFYVH